MGLLKNKVQRTTRFWPARCGPFAKGAMVALLAIGFVVQTVLVYTDTKSSVQLDPQAIAGRRVWMHNNCQVCHQMHGFGGFLGPDLTNAPRRLSRDQLDAQLTRGQGQMPAFDMDDQQVDALWAFFVAMDQTGIGQARHRDLVQVANYAQASASPQSKAIASAIAESGDAQVDTGFTLFQSSTCLSCHVYFSASSVGAPDLSISGSTLTINELSTVLENGRLPKMPPSGLTADQRASVGAFIVYLAEHRESILARVVQEPRSFWGSLPWWEFE